MTGGFEVLRGVFILGIITASHMTAGQAQTQMNPGVSHLQTLQAALSAGYNFDDGI